MIKKQFLYISCSVIFATLILFTLSSDKVYSDALTVLGKGHAPIYISNSDSGVFDMNGDDKADYFVKAHYTGNKNQQYKVDYKFQDECVDGDTYSDAKLKLGFTNKEFDFRKRIWNTDIKVWNPWFGAGNHDDNKRIDLVKFADGKTPTPFPEGDNGDDIIQSESDAKRGSFVHKNSIKELDGQPGWEGFIFFKAPAGEYFLWTVHPAGGSTGCDTLAGLGIPIIIND